MAVFVLNKKKRPLMPCSEKRARILLEKKRAVIHRIFPFTIRLRDRLEGECQPVRVKIDPGSKTTGLALVVEKEEAKQKVVWLGQLFHHGHQIQEKLLQRRNLRRGRRSRNLRYRAKRFCNRVRPKGWLAPSLAHRVQSIISWIRRLQKFAPLKAISLENVRFDSQALVHPEIFGVNYQRGTLFGYEIREYLLEKWQRKCAYCGSGDLPLEIDHIQPKSSKGSDRVSNLTLACRSCNQKKAGFSIHQFLKDAPATLQKILKNTQIPLKDAAAVNTTRHALQQSLTHFHLPLECASGGRTKWNRCRLGIPKSHALDAACVGNLKTLENWQQPTLTIQSMGRGSYKRTRLNRHGFPRGYLLRKKTVASFQTGDLSKVEVPTGKKAGSYFGRVAVRASGSFNLQTKNGVIQGISHRFCKRLQRGDGYNYFLTTTEERRFLPDLKDGVSTPSIG